jgi:hypothetical protein
MAATSPIPRGSALYAPAKYLFQVRFGKGAIRASVRRTKALWRSALLYTLIFAKNRRPPAGRRVLQDFAM